MLRRYHWFKKVLVSNWKWSLSACFLAVAAYDTWLDELTVIAATFIGLAALPWLLDLFDKITLPGGVEIELARVRKVLDSQDIRPTKSDTEPLEFIPEDPNLALVALRIELEKRLRSMYSTKNEKSAARSQSIYSIVSHLVSEDLLDRELGEAIRDMLPSMNRAAHGEEVPESIRSWVVANGPRLLAALDQVNVSHQ